MTDKPDWADDIAFQIVAKISDMTIPEFRSEIADALRIAKADGKREVASVLEHASTEIAGINNEFSVVLARTAALIREGADKIEKGEA